MINRQEVQQRFDTFRDVCQPNLYEFYWPFRPYHLVSCCAWGPSVHPFSGLPLNNQSSKSSTASAINNKVQGENNECMRQEIYFGTRADENSLYNRNNNQKWIGGQASLLAIAEIDIAQQGYILQQNNSQALTGFSGFGRQTFGSSSVNRGVYQQNLMSQETRLQVTKILVHPGEVNSLKCWPQNKRILASHSDHQEIFIWDINIQQSQNHKSKCEPSSPNIILIGHQAAPTYALAWSDKYPVIASGAKDGSIIVWNLEKHICPQEGFRGVINEELSNHHEAQIVSKTRNCKTGNSSKNLPYKSSNQNGHSSVSLQNESKTYLFEKQNLNDNNFLIEKKNKKLDNKIDLNIQSKQNKQNKLSEISETNINIQSDQTNNQLDDDQSDQELSSVEKSVLEDNNEPKIEIKNNKSFLRIQKNIKNYLNDPKPEKRKQSLFKSEKILKGHFQSVEDIAFKPQSKDVFCSVGVDRQVIFWDLRQGIQPVLKLKDVHKSDINTIDWCTRDENLIATGSNDTLVKILDVRKAYNLIDNQSNFQNNQLKNPIIKTFHKHQSKVHVVKFATFSSRYLASSGDSLIFWDIQNSLDEDNCHAGQCNSSNCSKNSLPTNLLKEEEQFGNCKKIQNIQKNDEEIFDCFNFENHSVNDCMCQNSIIMDHIGHIGTVSDFDWNHLAPWTIISASDDSDPFNQIQRHNESSLQIFRPLDLLISE